MPETVEPLRVAPALDSVNEAFWTGGRDGQLLIVHCSACGYWNHPPRERCRRCHSDRVAPEAVSGKATVTTFTINHQQWNPAGRVPPYVVALVELVEQPGLRILTNIVGVDPTAVTIGANVHVVFQALDDVWLPLFTPESPSR